MDIETLKWKILERPLLPIMSSHVDAFPFLVLFALLFLSGGALKSKKNKRIRPFLQAAAFVFYIFIVHRCFGALRGGIFGLKDLAKNDITAFYNLFVFVPLVSFTLLFGRVFCGWVCPLGTLQEFVFRIPVLKKFNLKESLRFRRSKSLILVLFFILGIFLLFKLKPKSFFFVENIAAFWGLALMLIVSLALWRPNLDSRFKKLRLFSLALFLTLIILGIFTTDPWCVLYGNVIDYSSILAFLAVSISALFISLAWCRYLCPLGSFLGLLVKFSLTKIKQQKSYSISSGKLKGVCPVEALGSDSIDESSCLYCGRCINAGISKVEEG